TCLRKKKTRRRPEDGFAVIASKAKQSSLGYKDWIASSQVLLAMTNGDHPRCVGFLDCINDTSRMIPMARWHSFARSPESASTAASSAPLTMIFALVAGPSGHICSAQPSASRGKSATASANLQVINARSR
ncbi:MAG TPA: hypothetical protein VF499_13675, partial [Afipia sp.]